MAGPTLRPLQNAAGKFAERRYRCGPATGPFVNPLVPRMEKIKICQKFLQPTVTSLICKGNKYILTLTIVSFRD